jgi:hypothetical protein
LRSMAAYAQLVRRLAGKRFLGDLSCDDAAIKRARLFGDDRETIAVVYTGKPQKDATIPLGLAVQRLEGIDGRELSFCCEKLPVPDGLVYAWVDSAQLGDRFRADVPAARLAPTGETVKKKPASPIVLRYQFDRSLVKPCSEGYKLTTTASEFPVTVRAFNLSPQESELVVSLTTDRPQIRAIGSAEQSIRVPAESHVDIDWKLDIGQRPGEKEHASITVSARGAAALPLVIDILP